jgi:hypothetical protein
VALSGFYNDPFQLTIQSCSGKIKPSVFTFASNEEVFEVLPWKMMEESENIRRRKLEQWQQMRTPKRVWAFRQCLRRLQEGRNGGGFEGREDE